MYYQIEAKNDRPSTETSILLALITGRAFAVFVQARLKRAASSTFAARKPFTRAAGGTGSRAA